MIRFPALKPPPHNPAESHEFAWDGVSFRVPKDWNLSSYNYLGSVVNVTMEDDVAVRLELEWMRFDRTLDLERIQERYVRASEKLQATAVTTLRLTEVPNDWMAYLYTMADKRRLIVAFHVGGTGRFFCFLRLHGEEAGEKSLRNALQLLISTLRTHVDGLIPWQVYDVAFVLPREFRLVSTTFKAGRKQMIYGWRLRRLYLWYFSLADVLLKDKRPEEWAVEFLNKGKELHGPVFAVAPDGSILAKRATAYPFGHFEEIGRWTFRYRIICRHDPERNQVVLAVFNYRQDSDLALFPGRQGEIFQNS